MGLGVVISSKSTFHVFWCNAPSRLVMVEKSLPQAMAVAATPTFLAVR